MATVKFMVELVVPKHQLSDFKCIAKEITTVVRRSGALIIESQWFFHEGDDKWYLTEMFPDSDAFMEHLADIGDFLGRMLEIAEVRRFEVFGDLSLAARATIASLEVKYLTLWEGAS